MRFDGKVAIITGAGGGIGLATARVTLSGRGRWLAAVDIDGALLESLMGELSGLPGEVTPYVSDAMDPEQVKATVEDVINRWGRVDILVNCLGGTAGAPNSRARIEDVTIEEWQMVLDFNLRGVFLYCQAVLPHMKEQQSGKIVNISSQVRYGKSEIVASYVASKAAIVGLTNRIAHEAGFYGVNANTVAPGLTLTPRVAARALGHAHAGGARTVLGPHPAAARRHARGPGQGHRLPGLFGRRLHHGAGDGGRRRRVLGRSRAAMQP